MGQAEFEKNRNDLKAQLEQELVERASGILKRLIAEILADPRTITAAILGVEVSEIIEKAVNENLNEYVKEE